MNKIFAALAAFLKSDNLFIYYFPKSTLGKCLSGGNGVSFYRRKSKELIKSKVKIRRLKNFAFQCLPKDSMLREILLSDSDELDGSEFCAKLDVWLKLARGKTHESGGGS